MALTQKTARNTVFYLDNFDGTASVILRGASGRWCPVLTLEPGEFNPESAMTEEQGRAHFEANKYEGDWLEL